MRVPTEEQLEEVYVEAVEHVMEDVEAIAHLSEVTQRSEIEEFGEEVLEREEMEHKCGRRDVDKGVTDGGHDRIARIRMVEEVGWPELPIPKLPKEETSDRSDQDDAGESIDLGGFRAADGESGKTAEEQGVSAEGRDAVEKLSGEVFLRNKVETGDACGEEDGHAGETEIAQGLSLSKGEDDHGPDEIELLLHAEGPEVAEVEGQGSRGNWLRAEVVDGAEV